jgi:VCBS repeat-containing protein
MSLVLAAFLVAAPASSIHILDHYIGVDRAMKKKDEVRRLPRIAACLLLVACTLAILASVGTAQAASTSMTFESLGYSTATQTSFTLDFTSPYIEAGGQLDLHFQTFNTYTDLKVSINGAQVYEHFDYPSGVQWDHVNLPTGVIDQGINTLQLTFPYNGTTVYEDSLITLDEEAPATGVTFDSLGYSASTNTSFSENFTSAWVEASGQLDLHFQTFNTYTDLKVSINGAQVYEHFDYPSGVQWDHVNLPTGVIDQGINTLQLTFPYNGTTVYEDSLITLDEEAPATGVTFDSLGYSASTNTSFSENFTSAWVEASGQLDLHFQTFNTYTDLKVSINGAQVYEHFDYPSGVQWDHVNLPTGVIDQGINTLQLTFPYNGTTVYEDSLISLNRSPMAANDAYNTSVNIRLDVSAPGVLGNDTDVDGDTLTAVLASTVSHGTLMLNADGSFSYTPSASFNGTDSFTYKASDRVAQSNAATVTIVVTRTQPTIMSVTPDEGPDMNSLTLLSSQEPAREHH